MHFPRNEAERKFMSSIIDWICYQDTDSLKKDGVLFPNLGYLLNALEDRCVETLFALKTESNTEFMIEEARDNKIIYNMLSTCVLLATQQASMIARGRFDYIVVARKRV